MFRKKDPIENTDAKPLSDIRAHRWLQLGALLLVGYVLGGEYWRAQKETPAPAAIEKEADLTPKDIVSVTEYTLGNKPMVLCGTQVTYHRTLTLPDGTVLENTENGTPLSASFVGDDAVNTPEVLRQLFLANPAGGKWVLNIPIALAKTAPQTYGIFPTTAELIQKLQSYDHLTLTLTQVDATGAELPNTTMAPRVLTDVTPSIMVKPKSPESAQCGKQVAFRYTAFNANGALVSLAAAPLIAPLGDSALPPGIELTLIGAHSGEKRTALLPPGWAHADAEPWNQLPQDELLILQITVAPPNQKDNPL